MSDEDYAELVRRLDDAVARVDGHGFHVTPYTRESGLSGELAFGAGAVWVKDETGNVSGSHKARHLFGIMVHLEVVKALGRQPASGEPPLAIASCGNAALAAAVVARAAERKLRVFIPPDADNVVVTRLTALGAELNVCHRQPGVAGDPCYLRFKEAVAAGALPFSCQGSDNGLTIDGGRTLGYELVKSARALGVLPDRVFVQVGGGALASSMVQALEEAHAAGVLTALPRFHAVQTEGGHPMVRAWRRASARILERSGRPAPVEDAERAAALWATVPPALVEEELRYAAAHRAEFMWAWEQEPRSMAHGILDDETYDWLAVLRGMLRTGGHPVVVTEAQLKRAHDLVQQLTHVDADPTGCSGFAGVLAERERGTIATDQHVAVVLSGVTRRAA